MNKGIDCASRLNAQTAANAKAAGFDFAGRYLVPQSYGKALTKAEAAAITGAGLRLLTVWELYETRAREGAASGRADGKTARACADEIGMPSGGAIYFAVDYNAQDVDFDAIAAYLRGARSMTGPYEIGVYGSRRVVEAMAARGACKYFWQCCAWSQGRSDVLSVYQCDWSGTAAARAASAKIGVPVDLNECPDMDRAGIWNYESEDDMDISKLTDEECWEIVEKANRHAATLPASAWAKDSCARGVKSGLFSDGDHDGLVDNPLAYLKRQELAAVLDRAGALDSRK